MTTKSFTPLLTQADHTLPPCPSSSSPSSSLSQVIPLSSKDGSYGLFAAFRLAQLLNSFRRKIKTRVLSHTGSRKDTTKKVKALVQGELCRAFEKQAYEEIDRYLGKPSRHRGKGQAKTKNTRLRCTIPSSPDYGLADARIDAKAINSALERLDAQLASRDHLVSDIAADDRLLLDNSTKVELRQHRSQELIADLSLIEYCLASIRSAYQQYHDLERQPSSRGRDPAHPSWVEDEIYLANLEYLLLCLRGQALFALFIGHASADILRHIAECQRQKTRCFRPWFSEFPDARHPLSTTWPWSIRPSLAVIWGVCWMFDVDDAYDAGAGAYYRDNHDNLIDCNTGEVVWTEEDSRIYMANGSSNADAQDIIAFAPPASLYVDCPQSLSDDNAFGHYETRRASAFASAEGSPFAGFGRPDLNESLGQKLIDNSDATIISSGFLPLNQANNSVPEITDPSFDTFPTSACNSGYSDPILQHPISSGFFPASAGNSEYSDPILQYLISSGFFPASAGNSEYSDPILQYLISSGFFPASAGSSEYSDPILQYLISLGFPPITEMQDPSFQSTSTHEQVAVETQSERARSLSSTTNALLESAQSHVHDRDRSPAASIPETPEDILPQREKPRGKPTITKEGKYLCEVCDIKPFNRRCEWNKHMDKHDRPYVCKKPECSSLQGFTYSGGLLRHQREVHNLHGGAKLKLYCTVEGCKRKTQNPFTRRENLAEHLRRVHKLNTPDPTSPTSPNSQLTNNVPSPDIDEDSKDELMRDDALESETQPDTYPVIQIESPIDSQSHPVLERQPTPPQVLVAFQPIQFERAESTFSKSSRTSKSASKRKRDDATEPIEPSQISPKKSRGQGSGSSNSGNQSAMSLSLAEENYQLKQENERLREREAEAARERKAQDKKLLDMAVEMDRMRKQLNELVSVRERATSGAAASTSSSSSLSPLTSTTTTTTTITCTSTTSTTLTHLRGEGEEEETVRP